MKQKHKKDTTVHQQVEYFFRHRLVVAAAVLCLGVGVFKYQARREEITRMPVSYGTAKSITISGE